MAVKKSLALTITHIRTIYANSTWTFISGKPHIRTIRVFFIFLHFINTSVNIDDIGKDIKYTT